MRKFSQCQLGIISESDDIFRIRVVVSDLNSEFRIFFRGHSEYSDNSEFFSEVNSEYSDNSEFFFGVFGQFRIFFRVFGQFRTDFRIICGNNMEIHENIIFLIRKSPNTPNSIFRANIRNLLQLLYCRIFRQAHFL